MKFDIVIGNPPYQENDNGKRENGSANASASPLYHHFFELSKNISNEKVSLIIPARWLNGAGKGLGKFSKEMLNDRHIRSLTVFKNSNTVFSDTEIKGGVLFLTYDKFYSGEADVTVIDSDNTKNSYRGYLNSYGSGVFMPYGELASIYMKVNKKINLSENNVQGITSSLKPFGLRTDFFRDPKKYDLPEILETKEHDSDIEILGLDNMKRVSRFIPDNYPIPSGENLVNKWKVFGPYAYGSGEFGEKSPKLLIGRPNQISTETFLTFGPFNSEYEARAFRKYFDTKFFRTLIGILKTTQHSTTTYRFIPIQDFSSKSDINWKLSVSEIDLILYKKYNLDAKEVDFIENKVKSMD